MGSNLYFEWPHMRYSAVLVDPKGLSETLMLYLFHKLRRSPKVRPGQHIV
jgi:hypothetical protein